MSLATQVSAFAARVATEFNGVFVGPTYTGDLNSAPFGYVSFVDTDVTNDPAFGPGLLLTMRNEDDSARVQVAYSIDGTYAIRYRLGGTWGAWVYFYSGHDAWTDITGKPSTFTPSTHTHAISDVTGLQTALDAKAPLASPALTGTPTAPTATAGTNTTQLATTAFVTTAAAAVVADALNDGTTTIAPSQNAVFDALATKQGLDATLTALAGVTTAADKLIYATGSDAFTTTDLTSTARTLLDDTSTSAMRTTLGLAIGTNVQAWDADLDTLAGLAATTDNFIVAVSSAWASRTPSQVRTTLGLVIGTNVQAYDADLDAWAAKTAPSGTAVGTSDTQTLTNKRINPRIGTTTSSSTPTPDCDSHDQYNVTALAAAATFGAPTGTPVDGQHLRIRIKDNGTARATAWNAIYISSGVATLLSTTVVNKTHLVDFVYDSVATKWVCVAADLVGY